MLLGTDELTILRGSKFYGTWQWINSVTGEPENFEGLTATVKIKNIHEDFYEVKNSFEIGTATVEPLDVEGNVYKGRIDIELSKEDTLHFAIPPSENDKYNTSDFYAIMEILLSTGEVALQAKVMVVESIEAEVINFLIDNRGEAIIINRKLDDILARNDEFIATRDNLIDVVIPTAIQTYNSNHDEKLSLYNTNDTEKTTAYNNNHDEKLDAINTTSTTKITEIQEAANAAFNQRTEFLEALTTESSTLEAGENSTAAFVGNKLILGIPRGAVGADGMDGMTPQYEFIQEGTDLVINLVGYVPIGDIGSKEW